MAQLKALLAHAKLYQCTIVRDPPILPCCRGMALPMGTAGLWGREL